MRWILASLVLSLAQGARTIAKCAMFYDRFLEDPGGFASIVCLLELLK